MAKTINTAAGMQALIDTDTLEYKVTQDHRPFLEAAKLDREMSGSLKEDTGYKKACTIPDLVAIEINFKHGLNIHDPMFMNDPADARKLLQIVKSEYPYLMSYQAYRAGRGVLSQN